MPISGTFAAAHEVPGLKQIADAVNVPLTVSGIAGAYATGKTVDILPISQASKDILKQPLSELGSLGAQVLLGGKIMGKAGDLLKTKSDITPAEAAQIVHEAKAEPLSPTKAETTPLYEQFKATQVEKPIVEATSKPVIAPQATIAPELAPLAKEAQKSEVQNLKEAYYSKLNEERGIIVSPQSKGLISNQKFSISSDGYPVARIGGKNVFLHDLILGTEKSKGLVIDHVNRNPLDNRVENLRVVTQQANIFNRGVHPKNTSGATGVQFDKATNKWVARITVNGKNNHLGSFATIDEAIKARKAAEAKFVEPLYNKVKESSFVSKEPPTEHYQQKSPESGQALSTRGADVLHAAVEKKLTDIAGQLPTHEVRDMGIAAGRALDFVTNNPDEALKIAKGESMPKNDVFPEDIYTALEIKAMKEGDVNTLRDLATSNVPTSAGQRLRARRSKAHRPW